jgi:outer membrane protein OmpA-like peptidoglycan-associated protein
MLNCFSQFLIFILFFYTLLFTQQSKAERNIQQTYEDSTWQVSGDSFFCKLTQTIDEYAELSVTSKPGEPQNLSFQWLLTDREITNVQVLARRADWQPTQTTLPNIMFNSSEIEQQQVHFYSGIASLLRAIKQGFWLDAIVGFGDEELRLTFANTFSDNVISKYQACRHQLSPLSWDQARDHEFEFELGERIVKKQADITFLKNLARYIALDPSIEKVMIDGHTDNVGSPLANRLLSKERADDVAARLVEFGLSENMLEVRAHGQRYPVANNSTILGKSSNRRVLIRLFRRSN